jgi:putative endonuclease
VGVDRRRSLGILGEDAVARWYDDAGYAVLARNWRCEIGEIDIVARTGATVVFCEVKTRSSGSYGSAFEAVTAAKQRRLRRLAGRWLAQEKPAGCSRSFDEVRFDVAAVTLGRGGGLEIDVLEAAF